MKSAVSTIAAILSLAAANPAAAALAVGDAAPDFVANGTQGGEGLTISLAELRGKGPVVLFFFPSAFTDAAGCRDFAANIEAFRAAGASVVGLSRDGVDTLAGVARAECAGKVPLASASESLVNGFDVNDGAMFTTRATYVVDPSGKIAFVSDDPEPNGHAARALAFVQGMAK